MINPFEPSIALERYYTVFLSIYTTVVQTIWALSESLDMLPFQCQYVHSNALLREWV